MSNWTDELRRLVSLRDKGILSQEEFEKEKQKLVPKPSESTETSLETETSPLEDLQRLALLRDQGAVSYTHLRAHET